MPVAICNECQELVPYKRHIKKATCKCGSKDLTAVSGKLNHDGTKWIYKDRKGDFMRYVPRSIQ